MTRLSTLCTAAALALLAASPAAAQTCSDVDPATRVCRFVLSEPQAFTIRAEADVQTPTPVSSALQIAVDGRVCHAPRSSPFWRRTWLEGACPLRLAAGAHQVTVHLTARSRGSDGIPMALAPQAMTPSDLQVSVASSPRLAALPREDADFLPHRRLRFWLF